MYPILWEASSLTLYSYPLIIGLCWGIAYQGARPFFIEENYNSLNYNLIFWGIFLFAWLGAKVLFLIAAPMPIYQRAFQNPSFWLGGGFVFLGGMIFAAIYMCVFCATFKTSLRPFVSCLPLLAFCHGLGRIGCFLAGCCYGRETDLPWGIYLHEAHRHPTQLYESLGLFLIYFLLRKISYQKLLITYLISYCCLRFVIEFYRGDLIRGAWYGISTSQWICLIVILFSLSVLAFKKAKYV